MLKYFEFDESKKILLAYSFDGCMANAIGHCLLILST